MDIVDEILRSIMALAHENGKLLVAIGAGILTASEVGIARKLIRKNRKKMDMYDQEISSMGPEDFD